MRVAGGNVDGHLRAILVRLFFDARRRVAKEHLVAETPERADHSRDMARVDDQQSLLAALRAGDREANTSERSMRDVG